MGKVPLRSYRKIFIKEWLEATGFDQKQAAEAAGVTPSYISNIGGDRRANPSAYVLLAVSELLGITVNDLFKPPPSKAALDELRRLSPAATGVLIRGQARK